MTPPRFRPRLEGFEDRAVPAVLTWVGSGLASSAANWSPAQLPAYGDELIYDGGYSNANSTSLYSMGPYAAIRLRNGYSGTVALGTTVSTGILELRSGSIDQVSAERELYVTSSLTWTGGTLNSGSTANVVHVTGGTATIAPTNAGTVYSGSQLSFENGAVGTFTGGTVSFTNIGTVEVIGASTANLTDVTFDTTANALPIKLTPGVGGVGTPTVYAKNTTAHAIESYDGQVFVKGGGTVKLTKTIPNSLSIGVAIYGGLLAVENGTTLDVGANSILVKDTTVGGVLHPVRLATVAVGAVGTPNQAEPVAKIKAGELKISGQASITISDNAYRLDLLAANDHRFGELEVTGTILWEGGTYSPVIHATDVSKRDRWTNTGTFKVAGNVVKVAPVGTCAVGLKYNVLESTVGFAPIVVGNTVLPTIEGVDQNGLDLWKWRPATAAYSQPNIPIKSWAVERQRA